MEDGAWGAEKYTPRRGGVERMAREAGATESVAAG